MLPQPEPGRQRGLTSSPAAWIALLVVYVGAGIALKSVVLNWIVGPLFPLVFLYLLPRVMGRRAET